jgi:hypothetical protein
MASGTYANRVLPTERRQMNSNSIPSWLSEHEFNKAAPTEVFFNLPKHKKVLHIGGHLGRESKYYNDVTFVEPIPKYANYLRQQGYKVIEGAVCGSELFLTAYDQASSVLEPTQHKVVGSITVQSYTLAEINDGTFDLLVIDAQGSELNILKSGQLNFKYIVVEASKIPRYRGAASKVEIENFLQNAGYSKMQEFQHNKFDIYDILFQRDDV